MTNYEMTENVVEELGKAGASKDESMAALMALQTAFLAQILDILECIKWNYNLHDKPEEKEGEK